MKRDVKASAWAGAALAAAVAAMGLWAGSAAAGDLKVGLDIRIGNAPPPPPPVVVEERVVVVDDAWIVGPRRRLYDADLRLRLAQSGEYRASEELEAARRHEGGRRPGARRQRSADRRAPPRIRRARGRRRRGRAADLHKRKRTWRRRARRSTPPNDAPAQPRRNSTPSAAVAHPISRHHRAYHRASAAAEAARADLEGARGHLEQVKHADGPALEALAQAPRPPPRRRRDAPGASTTTSTAPRSGLPRPSPSAGCQRRSLHRPPPARRGPVALPPRRDRRRPLRLRELRLPH